MVGIVDPPISLMPNALTFNMNLIFFFFFNKNQRIHEMLDFFLKLMRCLGFYMIGTYIRKIGVYFCVFIWVYVFWESFLQFHKFAFAFNVFFFFFFLIFHFLLLSLIFFPIDSVVVGHNSCCGWRTTTKLAFHNIKR